MRFCAISSCENSYSPSKSISFHSFPLQNVNLLKRWVSNMKLSELRPPLSYYLCGKHFLESWFDSNGKLKPDAIPSLAAPDDDEDDDEVEMTIQNDVQQKSIVEEHVGVFLCRICSCKISNDEESNMISIFDDSRRIFQKMKLCLPVLVDNYNDLPHHVCDKCCKLLERMYSMRSLSATTESLFFRYLSSLTVEEPQKTTIKTGTAEIEENENRFWVEDQLPLKGPVTCNLCDAEFVDMDRFDLHMEEHGVGFTEDPPTDVLNVVCSSCGLIFDVDSAYIEHKRKQKYECVRCDVILQSYCEMKSHECIIYDHGEFCEVMHMTEDDDIHKSNIMDDDETMYSTGEINSRNISKRRKYHCSPCNRQFQRQVNWLKHKMKHERDDDDSMNYECKDCDQQFDRLRLLNQHRERMHRSHQNWICGYCGKHTTTKLSLNIHERIHTGVKPFICEWCGNAFRSKANLSQHHAKHTGIRRHSCSVCGKKFSRKSFVTTHMRVHTGERPFACDICEQRFTQVGDMRRHRRRHVTQQQQRQPSDGDDPNSQMYVIQQIIFKDEKGDVQTTNTNSDPAIVESNGVSQNSNLRLDSKISIADIRAHFL